MDLNNRKISVIIPVYNAQPYLKRCLQSVCNQTLKEIEIICVNDASTDSSLKILEEYSGNYKNLKIINLEKNQGESAARNTGLEEAQGEYLAFVDNDDEIDLNFCEKLYEKAKETNADIVKGQAIEISYNGQKHVIEQMKENDHKFLFITYWWSAIYKRSLITKNHISFSVKHPLGGDLLFLNQAVIAAKNLQFVHDVFYHYHRREDSGDGKILSKEKVISALNIYEMIINNVNSSLQASNPAYNFIFHHFIVGSFYLALKSQEISTKKICAQTAFNIFTKCQDKNSLQKYFLTTVPHLFIMLQNNDIKALEDVLIKCKSRMELIAIGLRARINIKNT